MARAERPKRHERWQQQKSQSPPRGYRSHLRSVPQLRCLRQAGSTQNPQAPSCLKGWPLRKCRHVPLLPPRGQHKRCRGIRPSSLGDPRGPGPFRPLEPSRQVPLPRRQGGCRALEFPSGSKAALYRHFIAFNSDAGTKIHKIKRCSIRRGFFKLFCTAERKPSKSIYQDSIFKPDSNHATFGACTCSPHTVLPASLPGNFWQVKTPSGRGRRKYPTLLPMS